MSDENPYTPPEAEVTVEEPQGLATLGARFGGAIIDGLLSIAVVFPFMYVTGFFETAQAGEASLAQTVGMGVFGFGVFLVLHGYLLSTAGQTIGKRLVGTRIVSVDDDKILPFWKVVSLRYLPVSVVSQIPLIGPLLSIIDILFIFRADRRCIHDLIAGSKVVKA